jgi:hypothetical protein
MPSGYPENVPDARAFLDPAKVVAAHPATLAARNLRRLIPLITTLLILKILFL